MCFAAASSNDVIQYGDSGRLWHQQQQQQL
jgi:hypothetical protein